VIAKPIMLAAAAVHEKASLDVSEIVPVKVLGRHGGGNTQRANADCDRLRDVPSVGGGQPDGRWRRSRVATTPVWVE